MGDYFEMTIGVRFHERMRVRFAMRISARLEENIHLMSTT